MKLLVIALLTILCLSSTLLANEYSVAQTKIRELGNMTQVPKVMDAKGFESADGIKAIYFDGLDYEGKPTKVFAWLGVPKNSEGKVPGIVLVHGGGGTAFRDWVAQWNANGFAAIAFAHEGQLPRRGSNNKWEKHAWPGPWRRGHYKDVDKPLQDQWMYHALADTVMANSVLGSLPEVDASKIGIMGVSWGGVITSTIMGIDKRFAFAIPTYGSGNMADVDNQWGKALGHNEFYRKVWDPLHFIGQATMPALWFSWPQDKHFPLDSQAATYTTMNGPFMVSLLPGMKHSNPAAMAPPDSYAFAKGIIDYGRPWIMQIEAHKQDRQIDVVFDSLKPLADAQLIYTTEHGYPGDRNWIHASADMKKRNSDGKWIVTAILPKGTTGYFVNVKSNNLTASSQYFEVSTL